MSFSQLLNRLRGEQPEQSATQRALSGLALLRAARRLAAESKRQEGSVSVRGGEVDSQIDARTRTTLYIGSQALDTARYDPDAGVLELEFDAGQAYQFLGFPPTAWEAFLRSSSYGRHFNDQIRDRYSYRRVR
jgi:hypothetical protein